MLLDSGVGWGVQLTVKASYLGVAAHQEGFRLEDKNVQRRRACLYDDVDSCTCDISYIFRTVVEMCTVIIHELLSFCLLYIVFLPTQT